MKTKLITSVLLLLLAITIKAQITEVPLVDKLNLSTLVVEGKINSKTSMYAWTAAEEDIYTVYEIQVYKIFKGSLTDIDQTTNTVNVIVRGGSVGTEHVSVSPSLALEVDEVGAFLLKSTPIIGTNGTVNPTYLYAPTDNALSKYNYDCDTGEVVGMFQVFADVATFYQDLDTTGVSFVEVEVFVPCPIINKNTLAFVVTGLSPANVPAGAEQILTITGSGFGATRGTKGVYFKKNSNPNYLQKLSTSSQYISWSDTQIELYVPYFAGTGKIAVGYASTHGFSSGILTVPYAELSSSYHQTQHSNRNTNGGLTWTMNATFAANIDAKSSFERALDTWICETDMNWDVSASTTNADITAGDGINIVRFDNSLTASSGVLGVCTSRWSSCGGNRIVTELDIVFNPNKTWNFTANPTAAGLFDFETVALHELGHGRQLKHVIDASKTMHYALGTATDKRSLSQGDIDGGNDIHLRSTAIQLCGQPLMTDGVCSTATTNDYILDETKIYPNPVNTIVNITVQRKSYYRVYDVLGKEVISKKELSIGNNAINVNKLNSGLYFIKIKTNGNEITRKIIKH